MYIHVYTCMWKCICMYIHVYIRIHVCTCTCIWMYIFVRAIPTKIAAAPNLSKYGKLRNETCQTLRKRRGLKKQVQKLRQKCPKQLPKKFGERRSSNINYPSNYRKSLATEQVQIPITQQLQKQVWRQHSDTNSKPV